MKWTEIIKYAARYGMTALGPTLVALKIGDQTEIGKLTDAIADGIGASLTLGGLVWGAYRLRKQATTAVKITKLDNESTALN